MDLRASSTSGIAITTLDGVWLERVAASYGTPFYVYDADSMSRRVAQLRHAFDGRASVYYAVKANPNLALLKALRDRVDGLDVSSIGEVEQAMLAGHAPATLSFAGPAKTDDELAAAIRHGVGYISVESLRELTTCAELAKGLDRVANVTLRLNPSVLNRSFGLKMGGKAVQFGIDEEELPVACERLQALGGAIAFQGIHVYAGSQCFDAAGATAGVAHTLRLAHEVERRAGLPCQIVNLGGGFGVGHGEAEQELDVAAFAREAAPLLDAHRRDALGPTAFVFELGRYLAAAAGIYVARVVGMKRSRGTLFVMTDGGLHHHLAAAGTFGAALRGNYPIRNVSRPDAAPVECCVAGPSCNPTDLLGINVKLPEPRCGDLLAVLKAGSYGLTASPMLFLGRPTPAELVITGGEVVLGRRARTIADFN